VRFKFEFTSGGGNNIYIDDINISGTVGVNELSFNNQELLIFPNPAKNKAEINFYSPKGGETMFEITDLVGRLIYSTTSLSAIGENSFSIEPSMLTGSGIYFLQVKGKDFKSKGKLIWE